MLTSACDATVDMSRSCCLDAARGKSRQSEDADAVTIMSLDIKCKGALQELLPSRPTPNKAAVADIQALAGRCPVTLIWVDAEAQRKLTRTSCAAALNGLKTNLLLLLHKLLLGHLQNDQLDMLGFVSLGLHPISQAVAKFPACIPEANELCCAFALRFATDKRLTAHEGEGIHSFWSPGRASLHTLWKMLSKLQFWKLKHFALCVMQYHAYSDSADILSTLINLETHVSGDLLNDADSTLSNHRAGEVMQKIVMCTSVFCTSAHQSSCFLLSSHIGFT